MFNIKLIIIRAVEEGVNLFLTVNFMFKPECHRTQNVRLLCLSGYGLEVRLNHYLEK